MSAFSDAIENGFPCFQAAFGDTVTYTPVGASGVEITAVLVNGPIETTENGVVRVVEYDATLTFYEADISATVVPEQDTVLSDTHTYVVSRVISRYGNIVQVGLSLATYQGQGVEILKVY